MSTIVKAELTREIGNSPAGTVFEVLDTDFRLRTGALRLLDAKARAAAEETEEKPLSSMSVKELDAELDRLGLDGSGNKATKAARLRDHREQAEKGFDAHHDGPGVGSEEPGEGVELTEADNADLTDLRGEDAEDMIVAPGDDAGF